MKKAIRFQRSMFHMWNHNKESQEQNDFNLIVKKVWIEFGKVILNCKHSYGNQRNICEETKISADIIVITDSVTAKQVVDNCFISIYPPWQSMMYKDINLIVVLNVTRLQVIRSTLQAVQPLLSRSENKKFPYMCIEDNSHNFKLVDQGAEAILPLYTVDKFETPVLLKTDEQTASSAIATTLSTQNLNVDVLNHFKRFLNALQTRII
uniref:Uncharacterized protein n=3 Tax=Clastoptera arizonana TaxID=38151 RepID=A0A1B6E9T8_9HEMI